ncbi:MAG: hypothetical protein AMXMBFR47_28210 [Planctomycetota bacterium]
MDSQAHIDRAVALTNEGKWGEASAEFNAVVAMEGVSAETKAFMCHNIAICGEKIGDFEGAIQAHATGARWALTAYLQLQFERAQLLSRAGRPAEAAKLLEATMRIAELRADDRETLDAHRRAYLEMAGKPAAPAPAATPPGSGRVPAAGPRYRETPPAPPG